jgi:uncharacterized membrane protein YkoI
MRTMIYTEALAAFLLAMIAAAPASSGMDAEDHPQRKLAQAIERTQGQAATPTPKITTEQASEIALKLVPGRVTSVVIERKRGRNVYVVEIQTNGGEKDVFVDIETGRVVGTD